MTLQNDIVKALSNEVTRLRAALEQLLDEQRKAHAFIASSEAWGSSTQYRKGYLDAIENSINKIERIIKKAVKDE